MTDDRSLRQRLVLASVSLALGGTGGVLRLARPEQPEVADLFLAAGAAVIAWPLVWDNLKGLGADGPDLTTPHMDRFVALAVLACFATGQYVTGGIVALILVIGELLEDRSALGTQQALESLLELSRVRARRLVEGREDDIDATELAVGDRVRVLPGEVIPADGSVRSGVSTIDQAHITGESLPVEVDAGGSVFAGTVNLTGMLEVEVTGTGDDSVIGQVRQIVEEAKQTRAPVVRLVEEYARYYMPLVLLVAGFVLFFTREFDRAIAVIIASLPCAFVLAGPTAMVAALAAASRLGIVVKGVRFFEAATTIDTVVFDKTGTLTTGKLAVRNASDEVLALAAALARHSTHPVSRAVTAEAKRRELPVAEAAELEEHPGHGLRATVNGQPVAIGRVSWLRQQGTAVSEDDGTDQLSTLHVAAAGQWVGAIQLADTLRQDAKPLGVALRGLGVDRVMMLTGDRAGVAHAIAAELEIGEVRAECLPEQKLTAVSELKAEGREVLVLGDGVNDAPALAAGHVGVAMGALGSDVAIRTADVALMSGDLARLPQFLALSRRTVSVINQNLLWGLGFISLFILGSSLGYISPIMAALFHELGTFFVIFNSARLLRFGGMD
ncbi:MAG: cation-translocating P-type ATPase [Planctomycetota bacterium]